jgi:4-carboxymuconolactone decarboxylase
MPEKATAMSEEERLARAAALRRRLLGDRLTDTIADTTDAFNQPFQDYATSNVFGGSWLNGALPERELAMVNVGMLAGLGKFEEAGVYCLVAWRLGVSLPELQALLMHITVYAGTPVGRQLFRAARQTLLAKGVDVSNLGNAASIQSSKDHS